MLRVLIKPTTFHITEFQDGQNPYIDIHHNVDKKGVLHHHHLLEQCFKNTITYIIDHPLHGLQDIVFTAKSGLCLPRLPHRTILMPYMKYKQRKEELSYLKKIFGNLKLDMIPFPGSQAAPFEGQAELKWFHGGTKAVCGYGHRSTKKSFEIANRLFKKIYGDHELAPPELLVIPLASFDYYHLDVAMLEFDDTKCVVHKRAFSKESIKKLENFLGKSNVHVIDTPDSFCLNAVVEGNRLITHMLTPSLKKELESITHKTIHMVNTSEFEKSGGSVRCMTLDIF